MRERSDALWNVQFDHLSQWLEGADGREAFARMRSAQPALRRFRQASAVLAFLNSSRGSDRSRDAILAALTRLTRTRSHNRVALTLLWVALRPALDGVYRRNARLFSSPEEAVSAISTAFLEIVQRFDHWRVNRVASTLARSTQREVRVEWRQSRTCPLTPEAVEEIESAADSDPCGPVLRWMERVIGNDARLLFAAVVEGYDAKEIATALNISPGAVRKRVQRSKERLRLEWERHARSETQEVMSCV